MSDTECTFDNASQGRPPLGICTSSDDIMIVVRISIKRQVVMKNTYSCLNSNDIQPMATHLIDCFIELFSSFFTVFM